MEIRFHSILQLRNDPLSKYFTQFHSPLVKRINVPDHALSKYSVLVESDQLTQRLGSERFQKNRVRWAIAFEDAMRNQPIRRTLGFHLLRRLSKCQRLSLGKDVGQKHVVVAADWIQRFGKRNKVARNDPGTLMNQLVERMLPIGSWFSPVDRAGWPGHLSAFDGDVLSVAFHGQLLKISGKSFEVLLIGQNSNGFRAEKVVVPDGEQPHQHGEVLLKRGSAKMFVHLMETAQHGAEIFRSDG